MKNKNFKQAGMIRLDALTSFFLIVTLSSVFSTFATLNYFKEKTVSQSIAPSQASLSEAAYQRLDAELALIKDLIVSGDTKLNGDVFIKGEKLDIAQLISNSSNTSITGVASLQDETGDLSLESGTGITIEGLKITNNAPNINQNTFQTIKVSNSGTDTTFGASNTEDTLTFSAGGNISIIPDTTTKKLTISGTATGWVLTGSNITSDSSYNVGIGTTTPTAKLDVAGTASISGALKLYGAPTIQSTANQTLTIGGNTTGNILLQPLNGSGFVGIGTTSPIEKLQVAGNISTASTSDIVYTNNINIFSSSANMALNYSAANLVFNSDLGEKMRITRAGNVGIGTTTPTATLDVAGTASVSGGLKLTTTPTLQSTANKTLTLGGDTTGDIAFSPGNSTNAVYFKTGGNVGIGTATPGTILAIQQNLNGDAEIGVTNSTSGTLARSLIRLTTSSGNALFGFADTAWTNGTNADWADRLVINSSTSNGMSFALNGVTKMTMDGSGNLGIGTTTPTALLDVAGTASISGALKLYGTPTIQSTAKQTLTFGGDTTGDISFSPGNSTNALYLKTGGNVGIGTAAPSSFKLQVAGNTGPDTAPTTVARTLTTVDSVTSASTGQYTAIYCISTTDCKIAYTDVTNSSIMFADCDDATCSSKTLTTVATGAAGTGYISMYCVTATDCKIAYYDNTGADLKMADCDNATCSSKTITTVDTGTDITGKFSGIYCLATDDCKISYYDQTNLDLRMADCDNATCSSKTLTTVDSVTSANTGQYTAIYCISSTDCKIAYTDDTNFNLMMADCDNSACSSKTLTTVDLATSASTGTWPSIYCLSATDCKIAYNDDTNQNLMMADCDNATCSSVTWTTVDSVTSANTGQYNSIYCSSATDCKIVYRDTTNSDLMMADCDNATCSSKTLTTVDSVTSARTGEFNSIYCISSTDCKISYWEGTNSNLMMADCADTSCSSASSYTDGYNLGSSSTFFNSVYAASYFGKSTTISSFDLAETYTVLDQSIGAGDLVTTETGSGSATVAKSSTSYQSNLVGIVSTKPGITLSEWEDVNGADKRPVALAGRVPTRVNSENGPIKVGDYVTSSSTPGIGMRANKAGRVVGVALSSFSGEGEGRVEVFVNSTYSLGEIFAKDISADPLFTLLDSSGTLSTQYQGQILTSNQVQKLISEQTAILGISSGETSSVSAQLATLLGRLDEFEQGLNSQSERISSISATLANLPIINLTKFATGSAVLGITTVDEDFAVFGNTTLNSLNTISNITVANNLSLSSNSINTIGEDLQIQPLRQAKVSFMDGLVIIDTEGNVVISGILRVQTVETDRIIITTGAADQTIGSATISAGLTQVTIDTTGVTLGSKILLSPTTQMGGKSLYVSTKLAGESFTVTLDGGPTLTDIKFDWFILGTKP